VEYLEPLAVAASEDTLSFEVLKVKLRGSRAQNVCYDVAFKIVRRAPAPASASE